MPSIDTVNDLTPRVQYVALAAQDEFDYTFPIFSDADLVVLVDGAEQALDTDYTVAGEGDDTGGTITFTTPLEGDEIVTIYRDIPIARDTDIAQNGPWSSATYNDEQDKIFLILQQLKSQLARCLRLPIAAEVDDANIELDVASFANMYITLDADGTPTPAALSATTMTQAIIGQLLYPRTDAEIAAPVTPTAYNYEPGDVRRFGAVGDGVTNDKAAIDNALAGIDSGGCVTLAPNKVYFLSSGAIAIPDGKHLRIEGARVLSSGVTAITMGNRCAIHGQGAVIEGSGASGAVVKKTTTATQAALYIYGWPTITVTTGGTAGSIGLDFTASYKGYFQVNVDGYDNGDYTSSAPETWIKGGPGNSIDQATYYNTFDSPRGRATGGGLYGFWLREGCNGTVINNPQINGASVMTRGFRIEGVSGLEIVGGYCEGMLDHVDTRGILLTDANGVTVTGITLESGGLTANFAIGGTGTATQCGFFNVQFAGGWGDSGHIMSWTSSGVFTFIGGAPTNQVTLLGQTTFPTGLTNGEIRVGKIVATGQLSVIAAAAADYLATLRNTGDGLAVLIENNSAQTGAGRSVVTLNRAGGQGHVLNFQNNGSAAGGIVFYAGTPESNVTATAGTICQDVTNGVQYSKTGTGNTGWKLITQAA